MASIDKIWGNKNQYADVYSWAEQSLPELLHYLIYQEENFWGLPLGIFSFCNFDAWLDMWLIANCDNAFLVNYIANNQYTFDFKSFDKFSDQVKSLAESDYLCEEHSSFKHWPSEMHTKFLEWKDSGYFISQAQFEFIRTSGGKTIES